VPSRVSTLVVIGLVAGFFAGLFGVGGGTVIVPLLVWLCAFPPKTAMATSLAAIPFAALAAAAAHAQAGNVDWGDAALVGVPAVGGALVGAWLHQRVDADRALLGFAVFLAAVAVRLAL
jgi:uncharacterized protein